jgi:hypothetical protein
MAGDSAKWWARPPVWIELFVTANLGFLTFDIYLAHSVNQFRNRAEYIPLIFSAIAPMLLVIGLVLRKRPLIWKNLGLYSRLVGGAGWSGWSYFPSRKPLLL